MKKLFLFIAIPLVIIIGALLALVLLVNPNQFKPLIVEQAQKQTGLELVIEGDISWQFFPSIGFELGKTELRNPQGFSQPNLFKVETVGIDVSVMPLFSQQLEIGNITLDGAEFYLETLKDGRKNIDALTQAQTTQAESAAADTPKSEAPVETTSTEPDADPASAWTINLAGVTVSNAAVEIQDKLAGSYTKLYDVSLNLSEFAVDTWTKADFAAKGENNQQKFTAQGSAELKLAKGFAEYALRNIDLNASFSDPATKMDSIKLGLETFEFAKANALTYSIAGQASGLDINMKGAGALTVDKAISKVMMNQLTLDATFKGDSLPQSPMKVDMASDLTFDLTKSHLSFVLEKLTANALAFDGKADVTLGDIPKVRFALHSPNIDLDEFLGLNKPAENTSTSGTQNTGSTSSNSASASTSKPQAEVEPDLSALKTLDVKGDITIDKFKASNARMQNVKASFNINRGIAELTSFTSDLYQGSISATAKLDARKSPASYTAKKQIKGVKVQPLLKDVVNNDKLEGTGNIDVDVKGSSLTPTGIQKNLIGTVGINFTDGAVNGINVAQLIRENYAKIKGQKVESTNEPQKTDFSAMKATLKLNKGNVSTKDLTMQSPLLRIRGNGSANYLNQTVDFTVSTSIVGTLEGQGGKDIDELRDVTIPINISGSWQQPKFKLVFDDVLKQKAQKEIDRGLKKLDEKLGDKIKDEKTKEAVNGLLKGLFN
ncbi:MULTISPECIES: AsmA family protein [Vibrio]|uniref:AsmA family protein n=1 Tax=Vibrio TaxID=662 RepID=UPI002074F44F|nr:MULTISPECIES: AsmA family protein [Vibrio]USD31682.1 AsmA family protein [Vibrio sp. SCSIO 43186]USD44726.1 AsmA family protein [Vibrio sp. SCSIO 43145]USD68805.1 AsmA family protein [Vibrio sp. SCSIO 43139]USD96494.1 AsmA family protein [Vibrio coralliilyticus]